MIAPCEGYACPPTHSIPAGDVIVQSTTLAATGVDPFLVLLVGLVGVVFVVGGLMMWRRS